jgi:hypothetical protein
MKIWEVHAMHAGGRIRTTAEGHCEIDGLLLSEKAYLLAIRDIRPARLFQLVDDLGPQNAAAELLNYYRSPEPGQPGHSLLPGRSRLGDPLLVRSDEARLPAREYAT